MLGEGSYSFLSRYFPDLPIRTLLGHRRTGRHGIPGERVVLCWTNVNTYAPKWW